MAAIEHTEHAEPACGADADPKVCSREAPDRMFEHIHLQLKALGDVPEQLHAILDSVAHLRAQLEEVKLAVKPPSEGPTRETPQSVRSDSRKQSSQSRRMTVELSRIVMAQKRASGVMSDLGLGDPGEAAVRPSWGGKCLGDSNHAHGHEGGAQLFLDPNQVPFDEDADPPSSYDALSTPGCEQHAGAAPPGSRRSSPTGAATHGGARAPGRLDPGHFDSISSSRRSSSSCLSGGGFGRVTSDGPETPDKARRETCKLSLRHGFGSCLTFETLGDCSREEGGEQVTSVEKVAGWSLSVRCKAGPGSDRKNTLCVDAAASCDLQLQTSRSILLPNGRVRFAWTLVLVGLTVFTGIAIPIKLTYFDIGTITHGAVGHMLCVADACWVLDIIVTFHTAYHRHGILVCNQWYIAANYVRTWFVLDLVAAYPLFLAPTDMAARACSALKLLRLLHLGPQLSVIQKGCRSAKLLPLRVVLVLGLVPHILSCAWRLVQRVDPDHPTEPKAEWWVDYIADLYWLEMTMTTVGYGDIVPKGTPSRLFAVVVMLVAPIFFGSIVSILGHVTGGLLNDEEEKQAVEADRLMRRRGVPADLRRRVDHNLRHHIKQEDQIMNATKLLGKLSPGMQRELSLEFLGSTMMMFPLFQGAPHAFIADLAQAHEWLQCLPGNLVVEEGQPVQELVFIVHGLVLKHACDGSALDADPYGLEFEAGSWFGEVCLFKRGSLRDFSAYAVVECELAVLAASEYFRVLKKYPPQLARHRALERAINNKKLSLTGIGCVPRRGARAPSADRIPFGKRSVNSVFRA